MPRRLTEVVRTRWWLIGVLALTLAYAWPMQVNGYNQNAHYALVRALASGTPTIDRSIGEIGDLSSGDIARYKGHLYSVKPPGLAMTALPAFLLVDNLGMRTTGDPTRVIWALNLIGSVLPTILLVLLVGWVASRLEPGYGPATAITLGAATMALSFATLFFNHALSTMLGFASFALLFGERRRPPSFALVAAAGVAAGLGITADYQIGFIAPVLGLYALARGPIVRRGLAYAGGVGAGTVPLLAFNVWAFGSPTHLPYQDYWVGRPGSGPLKAFARQPSFDSVSEYLFSAMGLVTLMPVVCAGMVGVVLLARWGWWAEALTIGGVLLVIGVYQAGIGGFGGLGPPRYLMTIVPFALLPIAFVWRAYPLTALALALVSAFQIVVQAATGPLAAYDGNWLDRASKLEFVLTPASLIDVTGWYTITPFFVAVAVAIVAAALATRRPTVTVRDTLVALAALAGWAAVALAARNSYGRPPADGYVLVVALAASALVLLVAWRGGSRRERAYRPAVESPS